MPLFTMSRQYWFLLTLFAICFSRTPVHAGGDDPPLLNQPERFSDAVGMYQIAQSASPTEVHVEEPLTLIVTITGKGSPKHSPRREALKIFPPEFDKDFFIEPLPEKDAIDAQQGKWEFAYRLRPKHVKATYIPALEFIYYHPVLKLYQPTRTGEIELRVKEKPPAAPSRWSVPELPERFHQVVLGADALRRDDSGSPRPIILAALLLAPPLLCAAWYLVWRIRNPNAARWFRKQHSRAARQALQALASLRDLDGASVASIVAEYLRGRTDWGVVEPTPREVEEHLRQSGIPSEAATRVGDFFRHCDEFRFAPAVSSGRILSDEAVEMVELLEAALCSSPRL